MPELFPVKLVFTQEGQPLVGAEVTLQPEGSDSRWSAGGATDSKGTVHCRTHGSYPGVAPGTYKICVSKQELSDPTIPNPELFTLVDPKYADLATTDLVLEVTSKGATGNFDLGKPIRDKRKPNYP